MAALYAQGLPWEQMHQLVREYAGKMSSIKHLFTDLTLPIMSIFSGKGFDDIIRETFRHGPQQIEDLWLRCIGFGGDGCMLRCGNIMCCSGRGVQSCP